MQPDYYNDQGSGWQSTWLQHTPWLRTVLMARLSDALTVEEVLQDVAVTAWQKRDQLVDPEKMAPWLYRIAIRKVQLFWRTKKRDRERAYGSNPTLVPQDEAQIDPATWLIKQEAHDLVRQAMRQLSAQDREILMLKHTESWTYSQLSSHLGISKDKIIYRLARARRRLRKKLLELTQQWE